MEQKVVEILERLTKFGYMGQLYESLQQDDYSEVVIVALDVMNKTQMLRKFDKVTKCDSRSTVFRKKGNDDYKLLNYTEALKWYNKAISSATENSKELKLGFSNRSALLYTIEAFKACLNDIDTCFNMGHTDQALADRLTQRKRGCEGRLALLLQFQDMMKRDTFGNDFFNFNVKRNHHIPCASLDVDIVEETDKLKAVAVRNIEVGTIVALETAYACQLLYSENHYLVCHYCHKYDYNLIPCDKCCELMFCSGICKRRCNEEFHSTECQIMHFLNKVESTYRVATHAAIKMRQTCSSWAEFTEASKNIGAKRMKESSVNEIYDVNQKFSLLCFNNDIHFLHGRLLNVCLISAFVIYYLLEVPSFFPERRMERDEAIRAFARVMVNLQLFCSKVSIENSVTFFDNSKITRNILYNIGLFSFTGKLKHCCDANLLILGLNHKVALIAIKPIKKGDELTISYIGHYFENRGLRPMALFWHNILCNCRVCAERWSPLQYRNQILNIEKLNAAMSSLTKTWQPGAIAFKNVCDCYTTVLDAAPATKGHHQWYERFRNMISMFEIWHTNNFTIN